MCKEVEVAHGVDIEDKRIKEMGKFFYKDLDIITIPQKDVRSGLTIVRRSSNSNIKKWRNKQ